MKRLFFIALQALVLLFALNVDAAPISKSDLSRYGQVAFQQRLSTTNGTGNVVLKDISFVGDNQDSPVLAILNFDQGFLVIAADDAVHPVLAYSFEGNLNLEDAAPAAVAWIETYKAEILVAREDGLTPSQEIANEWSAIMNPIRGTSKSVVVSPLLTAKWNQTKYYNRYSPVDSQSPAGYDSRTPNGCVAVAMAMILYYYRYPTQGTGSHTNYTDYGNFSVNFGQQTYFYEAMQDELTFYNDQVAKLIFHCATSVDMMYSPEGSGAYSENVPAALIHYFGYNDDCYFARKHSYNSSTWRQLIKTDLDAGHPVYYSGYSNDGGHAFVCDGYDSDNLFHFNFGWGGSSNGFYTLSTSGGNTNAVGGFSSGQGAAFEVYPASSDYPYFCESKIICASAGTLEDGSSNENYLDNTHCTYVITEDNAFKVSVNVDFLDTEQDHDTLTFWNGNPANGDRLLTLSGSTPHITYYEFLTDSLYITFDSDDSITAQGWHLRFEVQRDFTPCSPAVINDEHYGTIMDGSGDALYGNNLNCLWRIRVMDADRITFTFSEFGISPEDELRFYNLKIQPMELLASYSGNSLPDPVTFNTNFMEVVFVTDNYLSGDGFTATWVAESNYSIMDLEEESMSVCPVPTSTILNVKLPQSEVWNVLVYDFCGRLVKTVENTNNENCTIDVRDLRNGIYFVVAQSSNRTLKQKFVVGR